MVRKRELIDTGADARFVRRNKLGTSADDLGQPLATNRGQHAKTKAKAGQRDKGDRPRAKGAERKAAKKSTSRKGAARTATRKKAAKRR